MLFLLSTLAFLQLLALPGLLVLGLTKVRTGWIKGLALSFALGGAVNYIAVQAMAARGFFNRPAVLAFILLELAILAFAWRKRLFALPSSKPIPAAGALLQEKLGEVSGWIASLHPSMRLPAVLSIAGAIFSIAVCAEGLFASSGTIFRLWDAVLSWNRWAYEWYSSGHPSRVFEYPQLVPTNWAMAYQIIGHPLQFVPKILTGIWPLLTLLLLFSLGLSRRSIGLVASVPILAWVYRNLDFASHGGEVDQAIGFLAVLSYVCIMQADSKTSGKGMWRWLLLGSITACTAAATKQSGIYLMAIYPPLAMLILWGRMKRLERKAASLFNAIALHLGFALLIAAPFYIHSHTLIEKGFEESNVEFVTDDIYGGRGYAERMVIASRMLLAKAELGAQRIPGARWAHVHMERGLSGIADFYGAHLLPSIAAALITILLAGLSASSKGARWTLLLIVIPYTLIWSAFYCYDLRNLTLALPFLAISMGVGLECIVQLLKTDRFPGWSLTLLAMAALFASAMLLPDKAIQDSHLKLEREIGDFPEVNRMLYEYHARTPIDGLIATDYQYIDYLPGLKGLVRYEEFSDQSDRELARYMEALQDTRLGFLLVPSYTMRKIKDDIQGRLDSGEMQLIFAESVYRFIKLAKDNEGKPEGDSGK